METTIWFSALRHQPVRQGRYQTFTISDRDIRMRRWDGTRWRPAFPRTDTELFPPHWRGLAKPLEFPIQSSTQASKKSTMFATGAVKQKKIARSGKNWWVYEDQGSN